MSIVWMIGALFLASLSAVVLMFVLAEVWAWGTMRDPREFFKTPEREQADIEAIYLHASHHSALRESHLPLIRGDYMDYQPFMLDAEPSSWSDDTRPAA